VSKADIKRRLLSQNQETAQEKDAKASIIYLRQLGQDLRYPKKQESKPKGDYRLLALRAKAS